MKTNNNIMKTTYIFMGLFVLLAGYFIGYILIQSKQDINNTYKCSTMAFDPDNTQEYDETDENNIGYFIKNTYAPLVLDDLPNVTNITLPTNVRTF